jgi:hypothetical protein
VEDNFEMKILKKSNEMILIHTKEFANCEKITYRFERIQTRKKLKKIKAIIKSEGQNSIGSHLL